MYRKVTEDIIKKATNCTKKFTCLSAYRKDLCKIESHPSESVFFIEHLNDETCKYSYSFGYSHVCTCPVRQEIYRRYKI